MCTGSASDEKSTLCAYQMAVPASLAHHRGFVLAVSMFWDFGSLYFTTLRRPSGLLLGQQHSVAVESSPVLWPSTC